MNLSDNSISVSYSTDKSMNPKRYSKDFKVHRCTSFSDVSRAALKCVWSGIVWKDGVRAQSSFDYSSLCVLDFDSGISIQRAIELFSKYCCIIGTTKSHTEENPRLRVIIPWELEIRVLELYKYNMKHIIDMVGSDVACKDGARFFYPCKEIVFSNMSGYPLLIRREIPNRDIYLDHKQNVANMRGLPHWVNEFLFNGNHYGKGRNNTCFAVSIFLMELNYSKDEIIGKLKSAPFSREDFSDQEILSAVNSAMRRFKGF